MDSHIEELLLRDGLDLGRALEQSRRYIELFSESSLDHQKKHASEYENLLRRNARLMQDIRSRYSDRRCVGREITEFLSIAKRLPRDMYSEIYGSLDSSMKK